MDARAAHHHHQHHQQTSYPQRHERERTSHSTSSQYTASSGAGHYGNGGARGEGAGGNSSDLSQHPSLATVSTAGHTQYSSGSSVLATTDYWPKADSDESDEAPPGTTNLGQAPPKKQSISSTKRFFRYVAKKFGKTYEPRYGYIPTDSKENDRNELQHRLILDILEEKLHLAPVLQPRRVLDVGTGPGSWAIDYAKQNPGSTVIGVDIEPVRPLSTVPRNCSFVTMDVTKEWPEFPEGGFDLVHVRMLGDLAVLGDLAHHIYENLNPGGWAEFTEWIINVETPDRSCEGGALMKWSRLMRQGLQRLGSSVFYPLAYKNLLRQAGFTNVGEIKNAAPNNACYPGKRLQRIGNMMVRNWLSVLEPISVPVFHSLGWSQTALDLLLDDVKKEIFDTKYHSYTTLMTVYCQKPLVEGSLASSRIESINSGHA